MEDHAGQHDPVGVMDRMDATPVAATTTAVQARSAVQAEARETRRAAAHSRAGEALAGVFQPDGDIDGALRVMIARACVTLVADRSSFLHRGARSASLLYEFESTPTALLDGRPPDSIASVPRPSDKTTASRVECPPTCNPVTLLRAHGLPTAVHVFLRRIGIAEPLGILSAYRANNRPFTPEDVLLLDAIANWVTLALAPTES